MDRKLLVGCVLFSFLFIMVGYLASLIPNLQKVGDDIMAFGIVVLALGLVKSYGSD